MVFLLVAACGGSDELTCAVLADPNNCWAAAAAEATTCLAMHATPGTLSADRTQCTWSDGSKVVFDAPLADDTAQLDHLSFTATGPNCSWSFTDTFMNKMLLTVDGKTQKVLIKDWQKHPFKQLMLHMDFQRVNENEAVRVAVPVHFLNQEKSAAAKTSGVVISHNLTEVEVSCLPKDLPEFIELDLTDLKPGDIIHLSQLKLPKGVEIVALHLGADHDIAVVTANAVKEEVEEAPAAEGEAAPAAEAPKK